MNYDSKTENSLWCLTQPSTEEAFSLAAEKITSGQKFNPVLIELDKAQNRQALWTAANSNQLQIHHHFRFGFQVVLADEEEQTQRDADDNDSTSAASSSPSTFETALQQQNKLRIKNQKNIDQEAASWKDANDQLQQELGMKSSSSSSSTRGVDAAAAMLNDDHVQIVGLHLDKNDKEGSLFGSHSFTIDGKFGKHETRNHPNNSQQQQQQQHLVTLHAPFVSAFFVNADYEHHFPAVKLSPWSLLFSVPPRSISSPVEECGILMVDEQFVFSSGSDLPTIPAFRKIHNEFWKTMMNFEISFSSQQQQEEVVEQQQQQHPMSPLVLDLILTLCNKKMTSLLNEYGKQVNYYEEENE
jgi:hypothetical protein